MPTPSSLNPNKLLYYPFMVNLGICSGICNTLINSSHRVCVPSETEGVNAKVFNMIIIKTTKSKSIV